jgi:hypothetical protein
LFDYLAGTERANERVRGGAAAAPPLAGIPFVLCRSEELTLGASQKSTIGLHFACQGKDEGTKCNKLSFESNGLPERIQALGHWELELKLRVLSMLEQFS